MTEKKPTKTQIYRQLQEETRSLYSYLPSVTSNPRNPFSHEYQSMGRRRLNSVTFSALFSKLNSLLDEAPHLTEFYASDIKDNFRECFAKGVNHLYPEAYYRSEVLYRAFDLRTKRFGGFFNPKRAKFLEQRDYAMRFMKEMNDAIYSRVRRVPPSEAPALCREKLSKWEEQIFANYGVRVLPEESNNIFYS